jgi:hypothetical protein
MSANLRRRRKPSRLARSLHARNRPGHSAARPSLHLAEGGPPTPVAGPGTITFDHATIVEPVRLVGEPDIAIDSQGNLFGSGPGSSPTQSSHFWKSADSGTQWHYVGIIPRRSRTAASAAVTRSFRSTSTTPCGAWTRPGLQCPLPFDRRRQDLALQPGVRRRYRPAVDVHVQRSEHRSHHSVFRRQRDRPRLLSTRVDRRPRLDARGPDYHLAYGRDRPGRKLHRPPGDRPSQRHALRADGRGRAQVDERRPHLDDRRRDRSARRRGHGDLRHHRRGRAGLPVPVLDEPLDRLPLRVDERGSHLDPLLDSEPVGFQAGDLPLAGRRCTRTAATTSSGARRGATS